MSNLPLASITSVLALKEGNTLVIYVEGFTSGFDGKLIVESNLSPSTIPEFSVRELPGNSGFNPNSSPSNVPSVAAFSFLNVTTGTISIRSASGVATVIVHKSPPILPVFPTSHEPITT